MRRWVSGECIRWLRRREISARPAPPGDRAFLSGRVVFEVSVLRLDSVTLRGPHVASQRAGPRRPWRSEPCWLPSRNAQSACHRQADGRSVLPEEVLECSLRVRLVVAAPLRAPRLKILTAIRALAVENPLCVRLATFVIGSGLVMGAIDTRVQIRAAAGALLSKANGLSGSQRKLSMTGMALHAGKPAASRSVPPRPGCTLAL